MIYYYRSAWYSIGSLRNSHVVINRSRWSVHVVQHCRQHWCLVGQPIDALRGASVWRGSSVAPVASWPPHSPSPSYSPSCFPPPSSPLLVVHHPRASSSWFTSYVTWCDLVPITFTLLRLTAMCLTVSITWDGLMGLRRRQLRERSVDGTVLLSDQTEKQSKVMSLPESKLPSQSTRKYHSKFRLSTVFSDSGQTPTSEHFTFNSFGSELQQQCNHWCHWVVS